MSDESVKDDDKWQVVEEESVEEAEAPTEEVEAEVDPDLAAAKADAKESFDKMMRMQAEMQNQQRRQQKALSDAHKYALDKFVDGLLPVIDSLESAMAAGDDSEGVALTHKMFLDVLAKFKVTRIGEIGDVFNPERHEAMAMQEAEGSEPNTLLQVFQPGYLLNERLIRPARVIVAK